MVYDDRGLIVDSKFFNEIDRHALSKLEGEELTFDKCLVDVLEELNLDTGEVKKKASSPSELKKHKKTKRKAPVLRMKAPLKSVYTTSSNGGTLHSHADGDSLSSAPASRYTRNESAAPTPQPMDFKRASRKPLLASGSDSDHEEDIHLHDEESFVPQHQPSYMKTPSPVAAAPAKRISRTHLASDDVRSDDALLALFDDDEPDEDAMDFDTPHNSAARQPKRCAPPPQQNHTREPNSTALQKTHHPDAKATTRQHKHAFFTDILEDNRMPVEDTLDEDDDGFEMGANLDDMEDSDEEDGLFSLKKTRRTRDFVLPNPANHIHNHVPPSNHEQANHNRARPPPQKRTIPPSVTPPAPQSQPREESPRHTISKLSPQRKPAISSSINSDSSCVLQINSSPTPPRKVAPPQTQPRTSTSLSFDIVTSDVESDEDKIAVLRLSKKRKTMDSPAQTPQTTTPPAIPLKRRRVIKDDDEGVVFGASDGSDEDIPISKEITKKKKKREFLPPERIGTRCPPSAQFVPPPQRRSQSNGPSISAPRNRSPIPNRGFTPPQSTNTPTSSGGFKSPTRSPQKALQRSVLSVVQKERGTSLSLYFPDSDILKLFPGGNIQRHCEIPDAFASLQEYTMIFLHALYEEMNLQVFQLAYKYRSLYNQITNENSTEAQAPVCKTCHQRTQVRSVKKQNQNHGRLYYSCSKKGCNYFVGWVDQAKSSNGQNAARITDREERRSFFRKHDVPFYHECQLLRSTKKSPDNPQWFIILGEKEKSSKYGMDDIWIVGYGDEFNIKYGTFIARGLYHCPSTDGLLEIEILAGNPRKVSKVDKVFAIRGPNLSTELQVVENLNTLDPKEMPFIHELLGHTKKDDCLDTPKTPNFPSKVDPVVVREKVEATIEAHGLNEDQSSVLRQCAKWFETGDTSDNIMLVHGAFGAGKSFLLTVLITFICDLMDEIGDEHVRILISSVTNVAVDNVLRGLVDLGFEDFLRIGSQQKIARDILPYTIASDKTKNAQIRELKAMLKEEMTADETKGVKQRMLDLKSGRQKQRESQVNKVRVVGVTCAASGFEVLKSATFPIIIQDESSQCLEPLALLPISRFKCEKLIAVGDPLQLPPTLVGASSSEDSLGKTLFVRLANVGFKPLMLRTQYRCHPMISQISNTMFYGQTLQDGITEDEREPLIPYMPPVVLIDAFSGKEKFSGGSYSNESEAMLILYMIDIMIKQYAIDPDQIGVISLYKPQAYNIADQLKKKSLRRIKVSTVDAFQGGEKDIVFLSSVKTSNANHFLESKKRLNVAITRAKRHLVIVGKQSLLQQSPLWRTIIIQAKRMNGVYPTSQILTMEDFAVFERNTILERSASSAKDDKSLVEVDLNEIKTTVEEEEEDDERILTRSSTRRTSTDNDGFQMYRYNLPPLTAPAEIMDPTSQRITTMSDHRNKRQFFEQQSEQLARMSNGSSSVSNGAIDSVRGVSPHYRLSMSSTESDTSISPNISTGSTGKKKAKRILNFDDDDAVSNFSRLIEDDDDDDEDLLET
eukprot:CAMPEP_0117456414 /NCGR_PEP_ID=MMETSP0759-20121206/11864_1 /TAXON_ID=63605 /ORGANISM="Percolomonas cosmopolitus, Strain WS" /LENGTH=1522 /DNA_ID=CAMNT_0005249751 /DNA_START=200 /DNA_END=4768 /DNA_ORIENTATION=-